MKLLLATLYFMKSFLALLSLTAALWAQTDSASLRVLVEDPSQSAVAGARVSLLNRATGARASVMSSADGYAVFSPILRGLYELEVAQSGFKSVKLTELQINVDERRLVRVKLEISSVSETVEVTADVASIH